ARRHVAVRVRIRLIVAGSHAVGIARTGTVAACGCAGHGGGWRRIGGVIVLAAACADHGESQSEGDGGEQSLGLVAESVHCLPPLKIRIGITAKFTTCVSRPQRTPVAPEVRRESA